MSDRRRAAGRVAAALAVAPLLVLPVWAAADAWRAPALWPQELGLRAAELVVDPATGLPGAVATSLFIGLATTTLAIALGWPVARLVADERGAARWALLLTLFLPLLVPPYAAGFGLTAWLLRLGLGGTVGGVVISHLFVVLPYVVLVLAAGFGRRTTALEEAAALLGAGWWQRLRLVTVPAVAPVLAVAALLGLVVSWGQYGTSLAVGGGRLTVPLVLLPFVGTDPQVAAALAIVFLLPPIVALVAVVRLLPASGEVGGRRGMGPEALRLSLLEEGT